VQEEISGVREEYHTQKKIFTSYRRYITCSRRINSFVTEDILRSLHLLLQKIRFLGDGINTIGDHSKNLEIAIIEIYQLKYIFVLPVF
jgi:hypothetical protein